MTYNFDIVTTFDIVMFCRIGVVALILAYLGIEGAYKLTDWLESRQKRPDSDQNRPNRPR